MKKFFFLFLGLVLIATGIQAQSGKDQLKQASKNISKYVNSPEDNAAELQEALDNVKAAFQDKEVSSEAKYWNKKGEIFNAYANHQVKANLLDANVKFTDVNAAITAFKAFEKALELSTKKGDTKDALNGLIEVENHLNNTGVAMYQEQRYSEAFDNFRIALEAHEILKANEKESRLDEGNNKKDQVMFTALSGYLGSRTQEAIPFLKQMVMDDTDQAFAYEALFNAYLDTDEEKAAKYLEDGRAKFPDDTGLLFAEINYYLKIGKLDILIDKLKLALEKEPDNVSIYTTIGNVYDNLHTQFKEAGDMEKASEYYDLSKDYYEQALEKDPDSFDAQYSLGALYYNKAADMTEDLNAFANDFSKEGTQKYNALKAQMDDLFETALPYFQKAESLSPEDVNTLIALKEIYARKNMFDKSNEYKERVEAVRSSEQ